MSWGLVAGLAAVCSYEAWVSLPWPLIHDAPIMHYIAWRMSEGAVPYRDLFDMNFPGVYLLHLAVLRALGDGDAAWRLFDLVWLGIGSGLIAALAAPWGRLAAAGGALFFAAYHVGGGAWQAGQRDFLLCPFLLAAALGVARWADGAGSVALVIGGVVLGLGITIKPHGGLFALALVVLILLVPRRSRGARWGAAAIFALGVAVAPLATIGWLHAVGALAAWREIVVEYLIPLYSHLGTFSMSTVYRWWVWPGIAVALLLSLGRALATRRVGFRHAVVLAGLGYGVLHYAGQGKGWEYHLYPLAAFAGVVLFSEVQAALAASRLGVAAPLVASLVGVIVVLGFAGLTTAESEWAWDKERIVRLLGEDLQDRVKPQDTVQVLDTTEGGIHALLRTRVAEPTRFLYDFHFFHDTGRPAIRALRAEFVSGLDLRPPRYIVVFRQGWPSGGYERIDGFPEFSRLLATRYGIDMRRPAYTIYAKRDGS